MEFENSATLPRLGATDTRNPAARHPTPDAMYADHHHYHHHLHHHQQLLMRLHSAIAMPTMVATSATADVDGDHCNIDNDSASATNAAAIWTADIAGGQLPVSGNTFTNITKKTHRGLLFAHKQSGERGGEDGK